MRNSGPSHWPMGCPPGFSQHLATVENDCQIDFCVKSNAFSDVGLPAIRRPPFMQMTGYTWERLTASDTTTNSQSTGGGGNTWEELNFSDTTTNSQSVGGGGSKDKGITKGAVAGISIVATLIFAFLIIAVLIKLRQNRQKHYYKMREESRNITPDDQTQYGSQLRSRPPETEVTVES
ncbi:hypothetical protein KUTeg_020560 [Tegillarca granosa]|uniref:Uncharacterized protein n=1 Tax=Tegillarca granosa TaxID=220873 RepID=A0ABQ9EE88_TEGGR|nr:hypothetical protein KUTeg_020560 [Tegillarca granosa]